MESIVKLIKLVWKIVSTFLIIALIALIAVIVVAINPFYIPVIFKNNYVEWWAEHPTLSKIVDKIYWSHLEK